MHRLCQVLFNKIKIHAGAPLLGTLYITSHITKRGSAIYTQLRNLRGGAKGNVPHTAYIMTYAYDTWIALSNSNVPFLFKKKILFPCVCKNKNKKAAMAIFNHFTFVPSTPVIFLWVTHYHFTCWHLSTQFLKPHGLSLQLACFRPHWSGA